MSGLKKSQSPANTLATHALADLLIFRSRDILPPRFAAQFTADRNLTLVRRLGHNVLKTGLRKVSVSYSRISLVDVDAKLHLPSAAAAEYICAKAIR